MEDDKPGGQDDKEGETVSVMRVIKQSSRSILEPRRSSSTIVPVERGSGASLDDVCADGKKEHHSPPATPTHLRPPSARESARSPAHDGPRLMGQSMQMTGSKLFRPPSINISKSAHNLLQPDSSRRGTPVHTTQPQAAVPPLMPKEMLPPTQIHAVSPATPYYASRGRGVVTPPTLRSPAQRRFSRYADTTVDALASRNAPPQEFLCYWAEHGDMDNSLKYLGIGGRLDVPDKDGRSVLEYAAVGGNRDLVRYIFVRTFVRRKTKVTRDELLGLIRMATNRGYKVLLEVILDCYNLSVDLKVDASQGHTLVIYAAREGQVSIVEMLCKRGADLEVSDVNNMTALHWAAERGFMETAKALIRAKAPLHIKNAINRRPVAVLGKVMNHKMFNSVILDAYGTMTALAFEYLICSSFPNRIEMVKHDIILFTKECLTKERTIHEDERLDQEDDDERDVTDDNGMDGPEEYVYSKADGTLTKLPDYMYLLTPAKPAVCEATRLYPLRYRVSFGFDDVFASPHPDRASFQRALREENSGMADNYFVSCILTPGEGRRLFQIYSKAFDIVGLLGLAVIYLFSLLIGMGISFFWLFYASILGLYIMARNALPNFFEFRAMRVTPAHIGQKLFSTLRRTSSNKLLEAKRQWNSFSRTARLTSNGIYSVGSEPQEGDDAEEDGDEDDDMDDVLVRGEAHQFTFGCSPVVWASLMRGILRGLWHSWTSREKERHTMVQVFKLDVINTAKSSPDGLLAVLVEYDVDSRVFGTDAVRAVVDLKWRTYGRAILKVEFLLHGFALVLIGQLLGIIHNPYSAIYHDNTVPVTRHNKALPEGSTYPPPASVGMTNIVNGCLCVLLFRVFCYEMVNVFHAGTHWRKSVWSWVDVGCVGFYALTLVDKSFTWASKCTAALNLLLWGKVFYYLKGFGPTSSLVQMVVATGSGVRWFLVLLGCIMMGFGGALYVLFRQSASELAVLGLSYDFADGRSTYVNLLSILMGNINTADFVDYTESTAGLVLVTLYAVLVVVVMLNLLISIVGSVYEDTKANKATEFVKAKAQIVNEMEQTYMVRSKDRTWFPDKLYFLVKVHDATRDPSMSASSSRMASPSMYFPGLGDSRLGTPKADRGRDSGRRDSGRRSSMETTDPYRNELRMMFRDLTEKQEQTMAVVNKARAATEAAVNSMPQSGRRPEWAADHAAMKMTVQQLAETVEELGAQQCDLSTKMDRVLEALSCLPQAGYQQQPHGPVSASASEPAPSLSEGQPAHQPRHLPPLPLQPTSLELPRSDSGVVHTAKSSARPPAAKSQRAMEAPMR